MREVTEELADKLRAILQKWQRTAFQKKHMQQPNSGVCATEAAQYYFKKLEKLDIKCYKIRQIAEHSTEIIGKILLPVTPKFNEDFDEYKTTSIAFLALDKDLAEKILVLGELPVD